MVDGFVCEDDPKTIQFFGCRDHGYAGTDSDVDLLALVSEPVFEQGSQRLKIMYLSGGPKSLPVSKDLLVYSLDEFSQGKAILNHVEGRASRQGKILHDPH